MMTIIVALVLLLACVAAIYLLLKNMGEAGVEIAAPGSCKRGRCGVSQRLAAEADAADEVALPPQAVAAETQDDKPRA